MTETTNYRMCSSLLKSRTVLAGSLLGTCLTVLLLHALISPRSDAEAAASEFDRVRRQIYVDKKVRYECRDQNVFRTQFERTHRRMVEARFHQPTPEELHALRMLNELLSDQAVDGLINPDECLAFVAATRSSRRGTH